MIEDYLNRDYNNDAPIINKNDDKLNRERFAEFVGDAILLMDGSEPFTIGMCGKWGSGKTSLINLILNYMSYQDNVDYISSEGENVENKSTEWFFSIKLLLIFITIKLLTIYSGDWVYYQSPYKPHLRRPEVVFCIYLLPAS